MAGKEEESKNVIASRNVSKLLKKHNESVEYPISLFVPTEQKVVTKIKRVSIIPAVRKSTEDTD